ncbi:MAG: c-type cytochrome [Acidobacteriaceae bacterium]
MKPSSKLLSLGAILCLFTFAACAQDTGATLFQSRCKMCHGADGKAATPTGKAFHVPSFQDPAVVKMSDADLTGVIAHGKNKMPAFGTRLSSPQIDSLVAYIRTLQK